MLHQCALGGLRLVLLSPLDGSKISRALADSGVFGVPLLHHLLDRLGACSDCHAVPSSRCGGHLAGPRVYLLAKDPPSGKGHYHRFAGPIHRGVLGDAVTDT